MLKVPKWQVCNSLATFQERGERYIWFLHKESIKVVYKLMLLFLSGIARHAQSTQNTKLALSLTCLKKEWRDEVVFFHEDKHWTFVQADIIILACMASHAQSIQNTSFLNLSNISRKEWGIKLIFCAEKLILSYLIQACLKYTKWRQVSDGVEFLYVSFFYEFCLSIPKVPRLVYNILACSLVVSDLRSETKGSRFESGCQLCAEVSSLQ